MRGRPNTYGTHLKGNQHTAGKVWVYHQGTLKRKLVGPEELAAFLADGWVRGRGPKKDRQVDTSNALYGRVHIKRGTQNKMVSREELPAYLADGWEQGCFKRKSSLFWVNRKGVVKRVSHEELATFIADGWVRGRKAS